MQTPTILIADDYADMTEILGAQLRAHGYTVVTAQSGLEAISLLSVTKPDILVLDVNMPTGSGFTVQETAKTTLPDSKVIMMSGERVEWLGGSAMEKGADAFLVKPIEVELLIETIRRLLATTESAAA